MQAQRELVQRSQNHVIVNIDVVSFERLAYRIFDELGIQNTVMEETGKSLVLRKIAEEKGIIFSSNISLPAEYAVSDMDMVCVLGNLIDNAIEACEKQTSKYIEVDISEVKKMILIKIVNSYNGEKNDTSVTSKKEKTMHGIGIKNVKKIVAKYKGAYDMECEDDEVVTTVTMLYK